MRFFVQPGLTSLLDVGKSIVLRRALPGACALVLTLFGSAGCNRSQSDSGAVQTPAGAKAGASESGTAVAVTPARVESVSLVAEVTGSLNAENDVMVGVKVAGKIIGVYAREGDIVRPGSSVVQQDTTDLRNQLAQQRANLSAARTRLEQAQIAYKNAQTTLAWTKAQTESAVKLAVAVLDAAKEQAAIVNEGARPQERRQAEENVTAAKADRDRARSDLRRYQDLYRQQAISAQQLDQAQSAADSADARYNASIQALSLIKEGARMEEKRRAQAAVEQANQQVATAQSNRDQVSLRQADVKNALAGIASARSGVLQAEAAVRLAEQAVQDATVRAPIAGVVAERKAEPGMQPSAGKDVMRIVALDSIYFDAQLAERQFAEVRVGQPVTVSVDARPGRTFRGKVKKIFPVASSSSRSFTCRVAIENEGNLLRPQMFARGRIVLGTHPHAVVAPRDAVLDFDGKNGRLFIAQRSEGSSVARERRIKTGYGNNRVIEALSGIRVGELIVTSGQAQLQDKDRIQLPPLKQAMRPAK